MGSEWDPFRVNAPEGAEPLTRSGAAPSRARGVLFSSATLPCCTA